ncbi:PAS domain S-box-containing protein/diguanylate cyclase (GGDEF) domain-containing protein [Marinobacter segnicrescens]|uniref:PAS domain S-box-containing protein/diguanylate cyclase (GGDEF) domain-containing protein n=1 Tax=Marinobacter segnicrescens TaxID=430453 RepID=A0A1H9YU65_9GAMM|nr:diguanylate cyclase [Marinobacter segnicrescens]SES72100.1 PAS domain S-box-containing protein/diguanylate cyclase (GGDEF) domain-containing protein [Marinobacter segnicrescens]
MANHLPIESIMRSGVPVHCSPDTPLNRAAQLMAEHGCSSIVVMAGGEPLGIWTEHDALLVNFSDPDSLHRPIADVMSTPVATLITGTSIAEAAMRFRQEHRRHFLVTDARGEIVGILSQSDIAMNQGLEPYLRLREVHSALGDRPLMITGEVKLSAAARLMHQTHHDAALILCEDEGPGVITERDMLRFISNYPGDTPVASLASRPLQTIGMSEPLIRARDLLLEKRIRHLGVTNHDGELMGLLGFSDLIAGAEHMYLEDLRTTLEQRDAALAQSRRHLQLAERVIESSLEGIIITDPQLTIQFVNPAFTQLTGYQPEEVIGRTPAILSSGRHDSEFYREMWETLSSTGRWRGEVWNRRKGGELYLELLTVTAIRDEDRNVTHYAGLFTDITQHRLNEERIRQLAYYDALTGLPNRRLLEDRLQHAIRHAHRKQQILAVMFVDLDHFKAVNDSHGHAAGDHLLTEIAGRLQSCLREDDTLARLGGDEFIVLLPELDSSEHAIRVAHRLIEANARPYRCGDALLRVGSSIGISLYPLDGETADALMERADEAMYQAKAAGRNQFRLTGLETDDNQAERMAENLPHA